MRSLGDILADESGLAAASVRPACHCEHALSQVRVTLQGAVTRFGTEGRTRHHACAEPGCGLPDYSSQRNLRQAAGA